jgi:ubiquinone/menaquinone biosynthesis C-methylase UbiE
MQRVLEPEVMDTWEDAIEYDSMDFTEVNTAFAKLAVELGPPTGHVLDAGTGTARIPILICQMRPQWKLTAIDFSHNMLPRCCPECGGSRLATTDSTGTG